jgi:MFS family permease
MTQAPPRDRYFWSIALQTYIVNFFLGGFGPAQSLLREDQGTSLTIAGLHGTAMGLASVAGGLVFSKMTHRFGRELLGWIGLWIFGAGIVGISFSHPVPLTIFFSFVTGFGVTTVINSFIASFSSHYGKKAALAIGQANGISSAGYVSGTLVIGLIANQYREMWRYGLLVTIPMIVYIFFKVRINEREAHVPSEHGPESGKLSIKFWFTWIGFFAAIATEFATSFWGSALIQDRTGATSSISTIAIIALGSGMGLGRWYSGRVLRRLDLDGQLKFIIALQGAGFIVLWLSHNLVLSITALLFNGLGISMQFALCQMRMIALSGNRPDLATGYAAQAAGFAIAGSPFGLAMLGDHIGISRAYITVPFVILAGYLIVQFVPAKVSHEELLDAEGIES